jgi:hypothetical protein
MAQRTGKIMKPPMDADGRGYEIKMYLRTSAFIGGCVNSGCYSLRLSAFA